MLGKSFTAVVFAAVVLAGLPVRADDHDDLNPGVWDPDTVPYGKTYGEWGGDWWNWGFQEPAATNPITDATGAFGDRNQDGPVWFLPGNFGGASVRTLVEVPEGKALFFPVVNAAWWSPEDILDNGGDPSTMTHAQQEAFVRNLANASMDAVTVLEVTVDGVALQNLSQYRAESPSGGFVLHVPDGSLLTDFGLPSGDRDPTVTDGYWLMLEPLAVGDHVINFHGVIGDPGNPDFELNVTYDPLTVVPEPSSIALLGMGAVGLIGCGWRRRRRKTS